METNQTVFDSDLSIDSPAHSSHAHEETIRKEEKQGQVIPFTGERAAESQAAYGGCGPVSAAELRETRLYRCANTVERRTQTKVLCRQDVDLAKRYEAGRGMGKWQMGTAELTAVYIKSYTVTSSSQSQLSPQL